MSGGAGEVRPYAMVRFHKDLIKNQGWVGPSCPPQGGLPVAYSTAVFNEVSVGRMKKAPAIPGQGLRRIAPKGCGANFPS
jgi:hypothetical protein